jgi:hypothetical protein
MSSIEPAQTLNTSNKQKRLEIEYIKGVNTKKMILKQEDIQRKIKAFEQSGKNIDLNNMKLMVNVDKLHQNPMVSLDTADFSKNDVYKQFLQMEEDYTSISMQQKFLIALGGFTITSLIITNYYL